MTLYVYEGEPGRVWPDLPVTPEPGDVVDWGERDPGPGWAPAKKNAAVTRHPDNHPEPAATEPDLDAASAAETQE